MPQPSRYMPILRFPHLEWAIETLQSLPPPETSFAALDAAARCVANQAGRSSVRRFRLSERPKTRQAPPGRYGEPPRKHGWPPRAC